MESAKLPDLSHFTGSEQFYRHGMVRSVIYSDGVQFLAESVGAYWLIDEIALAQKFVRKVAGQEFQVWKLKVNDDGSAQLTVEDGNDNQIYSKRIAFTDFPAEGIELWCVDGGEARTIHLPSEH